MFLREPEARCARDHIRDASEMHLSSTSDGMHPRCAPMAVRQQGPRAGCERDRFIPHATSQAEACAALGGLKLGTVELAGHFHVQSPKVCDHHRDILQRVTANARPAEGSGRSRRLLE